MPDPLFEHAWFTAFLTPRREDTTEKVEAPPAHIPIRYDSRSGLSWAWDASNLKAGGETTLYTRFPTAQERISYKRHIPRSYCKDHATIASGTLGRRG